MISNNNVFSECGSLEEEALALFKAVKSRFDKRFLDVALLSIVASYFIRNSNIKLEPKTEALYFHCLNTMVKTPFCYLPRSKKIDKFRGLLECSNLPDLYDYYDSIGVSKEMAASVEWSLSTLCLALGHERGDSEAECKVYRQVFKSILKPLRAVAAIEEAYEKDLGTFLKNGKYKLTTETLLRLNGLTTYDLMLEKNIDDSIKMELLSK